MQVKNPGLCYLCSAGKYHSLPLYFSTEFYILVCFVANNVCTL